MSVKSLGMVSVAGDFPSVSINVLFGRIDSGRSKFCDLSSFLFLVFEPAIRVSQSLTKPSVGDLSCQSRGINKGQKSIPAYSINQADLESNGTG